MSHSHNTQDQAGSAIIPLTQHDEDFIDSFFDFSDYDQHMQTQRMLRELSDKSNS